MKLLHLVIGQFRLLYQVKILNGEGYQEDNIARALKVHPYRVKLALRHTRKYPLDALLKKMIVCRDIDYKFKSSYLDGMHCLSYLYWKYKVKKTKIKKPS
jgi:DNA polymerase III, delta subunit